MLLASVELAVCWTFRPVGLPPRRESGGRWTRAGCDACLNTRWVCIMASHAFMVWAGPRGLSIVITVPRACFAATGTSRGWLVSRYRCMTARELDAVPACHDPTMMTRRGVHSYLQLSLLCYELSLLSHVEMYVQCHKPGFVQSYDVVTVVIHFTGKWMPLAKTVRALPPGGWLTL